ncbi:MAG: hypothetical protein JWR18_1626 [Segetibacter sp.]|nr:hypothetical protein [Segetibacter sp.]
MLRILYKYFILNKKAVIPGVGVFHIQRQPASLDFANKTFVSPSAEISFTQADVDADTTFYSFLSKEKQIEEPDALLYFTNFINRVKESLHTMGRVELAGFGVLSKDVEGSLKFQPANPLPSFFENVAVERTIVEAPQQESGVNIKKKKGNKIEGVETSEVEAVSNKKDYWWIFAIVLAVVAIASIFYYYSQNGSLR